MKHRSISLLAAATLLLAAPLPAAPYTLVELISGGGFPTTASGINDFGDVVGFTNWIATGRVYGFLYRSKNRKFTILPNLGGLHNYPRAIDPSGKYIVGSSTGVDGTARAMLFMTDTSQIIDVGASGPSPAEYSEAFAVNSSPVFGLTLVGRSFPSPATFTEATRWTGASLIRQGQGGPSRTAFGLNRAGVYVGEKDVAGDVRGFATFPGSGILDLPTLGGNQMSPFAINDSNQIVGVSNLSGNDASHAFLVKAGDPNLVDLGAFGPNPDRNSAAKAINQHGQIVGWSEFDDINNDTHAFLYEKGKMTDLNSLIAPGTGWVLTEATGINRYGQIVGTGMMGGFPRTFLLNPPLSFTVAGNTSLTVPENLKRLTLSGKGSTSLSSVTYRVGNRGKFLKARGTLRWRFTARLKPGPNVIAIRANGPGGVSKPTIIRIRRR